MGSLNIPGNLCAFGNNEIADIAEQFIFSTGIRGIIEAGFKLQYTRLAYHGKFEMIGNYRSGIYPKSGIILNVFKLVGKGILSLTAHPVGITIDIDKDLRRYHRSFCSDLQVEVLILHD